MHKLGLLTLHGMGPQDECYAADFFKNIKRRLGAADSNQIHFESIYYQDVLDDNQKSMLCRMQSQDIKLDFMRLRRFLVHWLSDATSLESRKAGKESAYTRTQKKIREALSNTYSAIEKGSPVVIVAASLGGQVISNYIWDAQRKERCGETPSFGIWCECPSKAAESDESVETDLGDFWRLKALRTLFTTGCNIPLFLSGQSNVEAIKRLNAQFRWYNYYDKDDVLGWPLQPLSKEYCELVEDKPINSGSLVSSWNPLSHQQYWKDRDFLGPLSDHLKSLFRK